MTTPDPLAAIFERIAEGKHTKADIAALQQSLRLGNRQDLVQFGKYNVNLGQGQDIHIGDRIYAEWNEEAIQALVRAIQKANWRCVASITENDYTQLGSTGISIIDKVSKQLTDLSQQSVMRYGLKLAFSPNPNQAYFISGGDQLIKRWQINT